MTTMFNAVLELVNMLGTLRVSTATGGDTTSILDTKRLEADDTWNGGSAFIITDAGGASAAPEGEWARVSDFANTGGDITISAVTSAIGAGDTYGVASGRYPLDVLISAINTQLIKHKVPLVDTTSLDIVAGQSEYTLPVGIRRDNLCGVYESTSTDSNDNQWVPLSYDVEPAATGTQHTLVIKSRNVTDGNDIKLAYTSVVGQLYLADDEFDDIMPMARILPAAAAQCELIRMRTFDSGDPLDIEMLKIYREDSREAKLENPIRLPAKRGKVNEAQ